MKFFRLSFLKFNELCIIENYEDEEKSFSRGLP